MQIAVIQARILSSQATKVTKVQEIPQSTERNSHVVSLLFPKVSDLWATSANQGGAHGQSRRLLSLPFFPSGQWKRKRALGPWSEPGAAHQRRRAVRGSRRFNRLSHSSEM